MCSKQISQVPNIAPAKVNVLVTLEGDSFVFAVAWTCSAFDVVSAWIKLHSNIKMVPRAR